MALAFSPPELTVTIGCSQEVLEHFKQLDFKLSQTVLLDSHRALCTSLHYLYSLLLQYSHLENPMDGGTWGAAVHGFTKSRTRLKQLSTHACYNSTSST